MRRVKVIEQPNETYPFAVIDQQTGEIPLRLSDRADLVALCNRLGWVIQDDLQSAGALQPADLPQRIGERPRARRPGNRARHRKDATKYTSSVKRQREAHRVSR